MVITVTCPSCSSSFPVDSAKITANGVSARCSSCGDVFRIEKPEEASAEPAASGFKLGKRDPTDKAKRLARVLVSDMIMYNAYRHVSAL
jgi:predicted Zn finger-like uncharacterized protein